MVDVPAENEQMRSLVGDVEETLPWDADSEAVTEALGPGSRVGRYELVARLGEGAMGVVFAARDPRLDRQVALKVLRKRGEDAAQRLLREAQALAKLSHPNVVTIHDVDIHDERVFIAMELVKGKTLRARIDEGLNWEESVSILTRAGAGLHAAHEVGLVHRDFKPENVMIGDDGRVRVMDFGLARAEGEAPSPPRPTLPDAGGAYLGGEVGSLVATDLTRTGAVMGTPAYMAPEQFLGLGADPRSDQFALCVALWEALYGQRPFGGATITALATAVTGGELREPQTAVSVPTHLRKLLERGLSTEPAARWPTVQALIEELGRDPNRTRKQILVGCGLSAALGLTALVSGQLMGGAEQKLCAQQERYLDGIWDSERRAQLQASFERTQLSFATDSFERVAKRLDAWSKGWVTIRTQACSATRITQERSEASMELQMACLDRALHGAEATIEVLGGELDRELLGKATELVGKLPRLESCEDLESLRAEGRTRLDPATKTTLAQLDKAIAQARAQLHAGRAKAGLEGLDVWSAKLEGLGQPRLLAELAVLEGGLLELEGDYEAASEKLMAAYHTAIGAGDTRQALVAARSLSMVRGYRAGKPAEGQKWLEKALREDSKLGDAIESAKLLQTRGILAYVSGDYPAARKDYQEALGVLQKELGPEHPSVATLVNNIAVVDDLSGAVDEAREGYTRALALRAKAHGPEHPICAETLNNLGALEHGQSNFAAAQKSYAEGLRIAEAAYGDEHPDLAYSLTGIGSVALAEEKFELAREPLQRALELREAHLGRDHPQTAESYNNLGALAYALKQPEEASRRYRQALSIYVGIVGESHPVVASCQAHLGDALIDLDQRSEATELYAKVVKTRREALGPEHPDTQRAQEVLAALRSD